MGEFDLTKFTLVDNSPDITKTHTREVTASMLNESGMEKRLLLAHLAHLGLHPPKENSIIQGKLPETATGE